MRWRQRGDGLFLPEKPRWLELPSLIRGGAHLGPVSAGGGPPFTPSDLSDLIFWLDADDLPASGSISSWVAANDATIDFTASGSAQPTVSTAQFGGQKAAEFDGSSDEMSETSITHSIGSGDFYMAFVTRTDSLADFKSVMTWGSSDNGPYFESNDWKFSIGSGSAARFNSHNPATGTDYVMEFWRTGTSVRCRQNGTLDTDSRTDSSSAGTTDTFLLGESDFGGDNWDGFIGDMILTSSLPSSGDRDSTKDYLADKFGITVS